MRHVRICLTSPPLALAKPISRSGCGRMFFFFSGGGYSEQAVHLRSLRGAEVGLSRLVFSGSLGCADLVKCLQDAEIVRVIFKPISLSS